MRDRVLVIDDDPDFRELCSLVMNEWGLTVLEADSCTKALALLDAERSRIRAVLLDYFMPEFDPQRCAKEILARVDPGVPVVLMSAAVDIERRAAELGLDEFLSKPFEMVDLRAAVQAAA
jgi:CheY-like chemotaxis protein